MNEILYIFTQLINSNIDTVISNIKDNSNKGIKLKNTLRGIKIAHYHVSTDGDIVIIFNNGNGGFINYKDKKDNDTDHDWVL